MTAPSTSSRSSLLARVENWCIGPTDAKPFRMFEILFTFSYIGWIGRNFIYWQEWLTTQGFHIDRESLVGMGFPEPFPLPPVWCIPLLALATLIGCLSVILKIHRRIGLGICLATAVYYQGVDIPAAFTLNKLFIVMYGLLLLMPGYRMEPISKKESVSRCNIRLLQISLVLMYLTSGLAKTFLGDWLSYNNVLHTQVMGVYRTELAAWCLRELAPWFWTLMQYAALTFELGAVILLALPFTRRFAILFGIGFHLMIALMMKDLIYFSLQMWTFYAVFLTADEWRGILHRARGFMSHLYAYAAPLPQ